MAKKSISFEINEAGEVKLEGQNFHGAECDRHIRALANAIGKVETIKPKVGHGQTNQQAQAQQ